MSIVEGNRQKFQLEESDVQERKNFIESTRRQIVALRDEVQGLRARMARLERFAAEFDRSFIDDAVAAPAATPTVSPRDTRL